MEFPPLLKIRVFERDSGKGVPNLALKLTLFARHKNNYTIPMVTDDFGKVKLTIQKVRQSIEDDWELFPMDYASQLEDCSPDLEIRVCSTKDVERTIAAMETFRSATTISDELIEAFKNAVNNLYLPQRQRFNVEETSNVGIGVLCRPRSFVACEEA